MKKTLFICSFLVFYLHPNGVKMQAQGNKKYPTTYEAAVQAVIDILDETSVQSIRNVPRSAMRHWDVLFYENDLINAKNASLQKSCARKINAKFVHFEDVPYLILGGVWDQLNHGEKVVNFETIAPEKYFATLQQTLLQIKHHERTGILTSLPNWLFWPRRLDGIENNDRNQKLLAMAQKWVNQNNENAYLGWLFMTCFHPDFNEIKSILDAANARDHQYFELPSFEYIENQTTKRHKRCTGISYTFTKTTYKDLRLQCYEVLFNKKFTSYAHYQQFIATCMSNDLMYWKFMNTLQKEDFEKLKETPRKLLEILILTNKYIDTFVLSGSFYRSKEQAEIFVQWMEATEIVPSTQLFPKQLQGNSNQNETTLKTLNALKILSNKLTMAEIIEMIQPKSMVSLPQNPQTEDILAPQYLAAFMMVFHYEELLNHPDKKLIFSLFQYYLKNKHISCPFEYFIADVLIQLDRARANDLFRLEFEDPPTVGNFRRHGCLAALVAHDFENNAAFIEDWYWKVHRKDFNHRPKEDEYLLQLLQTQNDATRVLYNKILLDQRYHKP